MCHLLGSGSPQGREPSLAEPHQVVSPELVMIWLSSRKRQHERYPWERRLWSDISETGAPPPLPDHVLAFQAALTSVARQFSADPDVALSGLEAIDGADVVQTPTGYKVPRRGVGTGHDPGGAQRDSVDLEESNT